MSCRTNASEHPTHVSTLGTGNNTSVNVYGAVTIVRVHLLNVDSIPGRHLPSNEARFIYTDILIISYT